MTTTNTTTINASADAVWKVLADGFDNIGDWASSVPKSTANTNASAVGGAPVAGRVCTINVPGPGNKTVEAQENVLAYDKDTYTFKFNVIPEGGILPVKQNVITTTLEESNDMTTVTWKATPELKPAGKLVAPLLVIGLKKGFDEILDDLKVYIETGKPSPRKQKAMLS